jgi:hypothetical protein
MLDLAPAHKSCLYAREAFGLHSSVLTSSVVRSTSVQIFDFAGSFCAECVQGEADVLLELTDQKARGFLVLIALNRLLPEHACKMFGEMLVRT